jgi:anti-sigma factor RsiW
MTDAEDRCLWTLDRIDPYLDGDLAGEEAAIFERHVADCADCREELVFARAVVRELRTLPSVECPPQVERNAAAEYEAAAAGSDRRSPLQSLLDWLRGHGVFTLRPAMAVMVVVIAAVSVFVLTHHRQSPLNRNGGQEITQEQVEQATLDAMLAFAYLGKYSRRTGEILRDEVITQRVIRPLGKTIAQPIYPFPRDE